MPTLVEIQSDLKRLGVIDQVINHGEIRRLPQILWHGERALSAMAGYRGSTACLVVATDHRVLFLDKRLLGKTMVEEIPLQRITGLQHETGWVFGKVTVFASGQRIDIDTVLKDAVRHFCNVVQGVLRGDKDGAAAASVIDPGMTPVRPTRVAPADPPPGLNGDSLAMLERLAALRSAGALTDEEFDAQKRLLLGLQVPSPMPPPPSYPEGLTGVADAWMQRCDYSHDDFGAIPLGAGLDRFRALDWGEEVQRFLRGQAAGEDVCPPGFGFVAPEDGAIFHILPTGSPWPVDVVMRYEAPGGFFGTQHRDREFSCGSEEELVELLTAFGFGIRPD